MAKRKLKELNEKVEGKKPIAKKQKGDADITVNKPAVAVKKIEKSVPVVTEVSINFPKPSACRIIVGSYEKVLCGIDARFTQQEDTVHLSLNRANPSPSSL
jgi:hypothetical protein